MRTQSSTTWAAAVVLAGWAAAAPALAQTNVTLGSVRLPRSVMANGQPLAAGSYSARLSNDAAPRVVGLSPEGVHWIEFVQDGQIKGRELATVVGPADVKQVAKGTPPAAGAARVQTLRGGDYVRVWFNRSGTQYLIHFMVK